MFRKPKRSAKKAGLRARKKTHDDDDDDDDDETSHEVQEALKRAKQEQNSNGKKVGLSSSNNNKNDGGSQRAENSFRHRYEHNDNDGVISQKDLATSTSQHHPESMSKISNSNSNSSRNNNDGDDTTCKPVVARNKFLAAPIRAPTNIRTTCRFDYQPDVCKDYKDTGFCGFGDTCIYLHDRGNTMAGWQLEQVWEQKQRTKREQQERQITQFMNKNSNNANNNENSTTTSGEEAVATTDDGLPFACYLCRKAFDEPIVTPCGHYFCQGCLQDHFNNDDNKDGSGDNNKNNDTTQKCPICSSETYGVMNQPTKLITKKRKVVGRNATWQEFMDASTKQRNNGNNDDDEFQ